jgi:hypothetical protein
MRSDPAFEPVDWSKEEVDSWRERRPALPIIGFEERAARWQAEQRARRLRQGGRSPSYPDSQIAARPLRTRDKADRVTPSCRAASVTVNPRAGSTSSRSVSPGCGGLCMSLMAFTTQW